jgi:hypothetical protein
MEAERERILKILRDVLDSALKERNDASEAFDEVLRDIPSRIPHPDGVQRIKNTSSALSVAREKTLMAITQLRHFELHGIIPRDLKKPAQEELDQPHPKKRSGLN